jgi:hypothetical protein
MSEAPHEIYRQMFGCSPIPHLLIDADILDIVDANLTAVDFYGYSRPQLTSLLELCLHSREEILALINQPVRLKVRLGRAVSSVSVCPFC